MAEVEIAPSFGAELKDGFKPVNAWVAGGIQFLDDVQQFYRERSAVEKEYAGKLSALAKKFFEKKAKRSSSLSVGDTPTVTPGSLESASMTTWATQLSALENRAAEHERFAAQLIANLADPLAQLARRSEDLRKQHAEYAAKLEKERDGGYAELKKTKAKYDTACQEVENKRKKTDGHSLDKSKAQTSYNQSMAEMRNIKNTYLIAINVTNKQKERYYHDYVPELLDSLQTLSESRTSGLNNIWLSAATIEAQTMTNSTQIIDRLKGEIPRNNPVLDSMMFTRHNALQWQEPVNFAFEPSPVWLDDDRMAADAASKTFLMNILSKSKTSVAQLKRECDGLSREVEGAKQVRQAIREGKDKRDEVEVVRMQFQNQELLHDAERKKTVAEVEVSTIVHSVGDVSRGARGHTFKPQTFKIPTNCDLCGDRIWGLSAKGLSCEECGYTCHTKCELKVPADCPGELSKEQKKTIKAERQAAAQAAAAEPVAVEVNGATSAGSAVAPPLARSDTLNTLSSGYAASAQRSVSGASLSQQRASVAEEIAPPSPTSPATTPSAAPAAPAPRRRMAAPPPAQYITPPNGASISDFEETPQKGRMLYGYTASGEGEISVTENSEFTLLEPDDGSGWIKVKPSSLGAPAGLVPASYAELHAKRERSPMPVERPVSRASTTGSESTSGAGVKVKKQGPAVAPRRGKKTVAVKHVEALYTYSAGGPGETDMVEGERMVLIATDGGDGWCEVEGRSGRGVVPASWVKEV